MERKLQLGNNPPGRLSRKRESMLAAIQLLQAFFRVLEANAAAPNGMS